MNNSLIEFLFLVSSFHCLKAVLTFDFMKYWPSFSALLGRFAANNPPKPVMLDPILSLFVLYSANELIHSLKGWIEGDVGIFIGQNELFVSVYKIDLVGLASSICSVLTRWFIVNLKEETKLLLEKSDILMIVCPGLESSKLIFLLIDLLDALEFELELSEYSTSTSLHVLAPRVGLLGYAIYSSSSLSSSTINCCLSEISIRFWSESWDSLYLFELFNMLFMNDFLLWVLPVETIAELLTFLLWVPSLFDNLLSVP